MPARFISTQNIFGGHFRERTKIQQKRPKFADLIYFHAEVFLEVILESVQKSNKKGQNLPARFIFKQMYVLEIETEFLWQFLLISLLRSRSSLRLPCSLRARTSCTTHLETPCYPTFTETETDGLGECPGYCRAVLLGWIMLHRGLSTIDI